MAPDADEEWLKQSQDNGALNQDVPTNFPDPDVEWAALQECVPTVGIVKSSSLPILADAPDPDHAWALLEHGAPVTATASAGTGILPAAPDPDAQWLSLQSVGNPTLVSPQRPLINPSAPDLGGYFTPQLLYIPHDTIIPVDTTGSMWAPKPRKKPVPKKKQKWPLLEAGTTVPGKDLLHVNYEPIDVDAKWASLDREGPVPEIPIAASAIRSPAFNFQLIDPNAAWSALTGHTSAKDPNSSSLPPPAEYSETWWVGKSKSSPPPHPGAENDISMGDLENDSSDDGCSGSDASNFVTPRQRITLPSPTLSALAMADVSFFQSMVDDDIFVDDVIEPASEGYF